MLPTVHRRFAHDPQISADLSSQVDQSDVWHLCYAHLDWLTLSANHNIPSLPPFTFTFLQQYTVCAELMVTHLVSSCPNNNINHRKIVFSHFPILLYQSPGDASAGIIVIGWHSRHTLYTLSVFKVLYLARSILSAKSNQTPRRKMWSPKLKNLKSKIAFLLNKSVILSLNYLI